MINNYKNTYKDYINNNINLDRNTKLAIICLIIVIAGIFGYIYEFIFYYFNSGMKQFYLRGSNFLPWINIYAIGAIFILLLTYKHKKSATKVFLISFIACGLLEYVSGWGMYTLFDGFRCWDYNTEIMNFGNIGGFVCLRSVLFFGLSGLMLIYLIVPICLYLSNTMNKKVFFVFCFALCAIIMFDEIYNLVIARILNLNRASDVYKSLGFRYMNFIK